VAGGPEAGVDCVGGAVSSSELSSELLSSSEELLASCEDGGASLAAADVGFPAGSTAGTAALPAEGNSICKVDD
jgi:hypothetical protein